jgi:general secretion pathway protein G
MVKKNKTAASPPRSQPYAISGFTLLELMIVVAIAATLASIAIPYYISYRTRAEVGGAVAELKMLEMAIGEYAVSNSELPDSLDELDMGIPDDPWGNPYRYLKIEGGSSPPGQLRKDHFTVPVNSDFDLYSMGKDGESMAPFTAQQSRDDVVRANNGGYFGPVSDY